MLQEESRVYNSRKVDQVGKEALPLDPVIIVGEVEGVVGGGAASIQQTEVTDEAEQTLTVIRGMVLQHVLKANFRTDG